MERVERLETNACSCRHADDEKLAKKVWELLGSRKDIYWSDCDALYFDFSVIPNHIQESLQIWRDAYFIFGITDQAEFVSKWIDRWEFDKD